MYLLVKFGFCTFYLHIYIRTYMDIIFIYANIIRNWLKELKGAYWGQIDILHYFVKEKSNFSFFKIRCSGA